MQGCLTRSRNLNPEKTAIALPPSSTLFASSADGPAAGDVSQRGRVRGNPRLWRGCAAPCRQPRLHFGRGHLRPAQRARRAQRGRYGELAAGRFRSAGLPGYVAADGRLGARPRQHRPRRDRNVGRHLAEYAQSERSADRSEHSIRPNSFATRQARPRRKHRARNAARFAVAIAAGRLRHRNRRPRPADAHCRV